ncbi:alpha/beta fold hydrolase [Bdellovibrio sp. HCB-110]|uniref:alpha/beta fold hydrolase n=1 Tax=Bdellovibrio sp. HCB-110 TaxID=3391182 RepID=UPI0039B67593
MAKVEQINVRETKQWISYSGNEAGSIILFVHGGPGSPLMMFSESFDKELAKKFLVVHWDQRGAGKSYTPEVFSKPLSVQDYVLDGLEVVKVLKQKMPGKKIILVGHSWGTIVASHIVKAQPELFSAYVSVGTVVDYAKADELKYQFLHRDHAALEPPPYHKWAQVMEVSQGLMKAHRVFHNLTLDEVNKAAGSGKIYSIEDLKNQGLSAQKSFEALIPYLGKYNAFTEMPQIAVPTYFIQGTFDMATPTELVKKYYDKVLAPKGKEFIEFKKSAHFPMFEEATLFAETLKKVNGK